MLKRLVLPTLLATAASALAQSPQAPKTDLRANGAFDFPQKRATILCDTPTLRLSAFNNADYLFVQAILWTDDSDELGETDDGRKIGDNSDLVIDADPPTKAQPAKDPAANNPALQGRDYSLNPWPKLPGLHYSVELGNSMSTPLQSDSRGHGAIAYLTAADGKKVRVDTFLIPLAEIGRKPGAKIHIAYYAQSTKPDLTVNSIGFTSKRPYYSFHLPRKQFHTFTLASNAETIDIDKVPEGRDTIKITQEKPVPMPELNKAPPPVTAAKWINWPGQTPPTLAGLKGKVVLVEFWATWCGPCVAGIPHLKALHEKYAKDGLVILSLTDQSARPIEKFAREKEMKFTIGAGSETLKTYGVTGIPHAFLISRTGLLLWHGYPADKECEQRITAAIASK